MPRKRSISDESLLDAALDVIRGDGPDALTFGAVGARAGLSPSTIVQRFGTKNELLRAALLRAWDHLDEATTKAVAAAGDGPAGVTELLVRLSGQYDAHDFADQLRVLREDLRDPVLTARGREWLSRLAAAVDERLGDAAPGTGALVVAQWQGTLTVWGFTRRGSVRRAVRSSIDELLRRLL